MLPRQALSLLSRAPIAPRAAPLAAGRLRPIASRWLSSASSSATQPEKGALFSLDDYAKESSDRYKSKYAELLAKAPPKKEDPAKAAAASATPPPPKIFNRKLTDILDLDALKSLSASEIAALWAEHLAKPVEVTATPDDGDFFAPPATPTKELVQARMGGGLDPATYERLMKNASRYPHFLIPLFRKEGIELFFAQAQYNRMALTTLLEYRTRGSEAQPALVAEVFGDLINWTGGEANATPSGLGLYRVDFEPKRITLGAAQSLFASVLKAFGTPEGEQVLRRFCEAPQDFNIDEIIGKDGLFPNDIGTGGPSAE
ncbi:hypothetical protein H696_00209 [Fonticula alba]|uniref:Uncharacterized protein n=1 Tax=Fonticula alba TaxID=691883 RepID=A0A058ZDZ9_FONAL|nr:hypothetical protein H696_00209 [Fonticula alba]KCV72625.1 hypothetical protein H696_00209 [Fonticula alba]|eukprot:XP_009492326.1 hypothetical protein H696_00209 [Fonticula alba]